MKRSLLNPIQFAVVREDPLSDARVLRDTPARRAVLIGSGGCTAFSLQAMFPDLEIHLIDPNAAQLDLVRRKAELLQSGAPAADLKRAFGVGPTDNSHSLNGCGNFESLFRSLRSFLQEFVMDRTEFEKMFTSESELRSGRERLLAHKYWSVAFDLFFSESILNAMFTENATQHAPRGSYPAYFRKVLEQELASKRALTNYFLHHVLLGHYVEGSEPTYLASPLPRQYRFEYLQATLDQVPGLDRFDFIHLSNIMDWMAPADVESLAKTIATQAKPGAAILYRQLNNSRDLRGLFAPRFRFDERLSAELLANDRSLFYCKMEAGFAQ